MRNLTLSNLSISGTASSENSVGGVAGLNLGLISNVTVTGAVHETGSSLAVGGVVGENLGAIMNSTAMVDVTVASGSGIGGFVGVNSRGTISSSSASGTVTVTSGLRHWRLCRNKHRQRHNYIFVRDGHGERSNGFS